MFRLRACDEIGWANVKSLEETVGAGGSRYMDIIKQGSGNTHIETKYYATFENKSITNINDYLTQIQKDLENGYPFEHWLSKTNSITTETQLHQEIKMILTDAKYDNLFINKYVGAGKRFETFNDFISSKFKFKDFNATN